MGGCTAPLGRLPRPRSAPSSPPVLQVQPVLEELRVVGVVGVRRRRGGRHLGIYDFQYFFLCIYLCRHLYDGHFHAGGFGLAPGGGVGAGVGLGDSHWRPGGEEQGWTSRTI